jgi:2-polyprenyl-3-methyl-5-hydroxy-6-metoxy-1,4-benzoquinol methylase
MGGRNNEKNTMSIRDNLGLKIFDIDAHSLRGKNFYKSIVDYRNKILPQQLGRIKEDSEYVCTLCSGKSGTLFLEWEEGYKLFKCSDCGSVSPNIILSDDEYISSVYDVKEYREKFMRETHAQYEYRKNNFGQERFQYTVARLNLNNQAKVLDVGCGAGYYISVLNDKKIKYKGLEVADHLVEYCKSYHNLNVEKTPLEDEEDNYYDLITMFDVLEHLSAPVETFNSVNQKLKKGGYCIAYTPNIFSVGYELMGSKQNTLLPFEHLCFFSTESIEYLANNTGFEVEKIETFGLDIMDYLLMKEYEDGIEYTNNLSDLMTLMQSLIDKYNISNHFRITFRKIK